MKTRLQINLGNEHDSFGGESAPKRKGVLGEMLTHRNDPRMHRVIENAVQGFKGPQDFETSILFAIWFVGEQSKRHQFASVVSVLAIPALLGERALDGGRAAIAIVLTLRMLGYIELTEDNQLKVNRQEDIARATKEIASEVEALREAVDEMIEPQPLSALDVAGEGPARFLALFA